MEADHFDVVVCGLGAMGSAALQRLAMRRLRVMGLERHAPGHDRGSSHGLTRIIRLGYFEHASYVPLLRRAYELWRELEAAAGRTLLHVTGIAEIGAPESALVQGTLASCRLHALRHEVLAAAAGAKIRSGEIVRSIEPRAGSVRIVTDRATVEAGAAVITLGAWTRSLLPALPLRATRQVMAWFDPVDAGLCSALPVFIIESRHGMHYGIPPQREAGAGPGIKLAKHHHRDLAVDPEDYDRTVSADDEALIRAAAADYVPAANGRLLAARTCLYTMTPDGDFLIDRLPGAANVIVASPCSGHGFKFAPVIGEILADLATTGTTAHDIARFRLARFG